MSLYVLSGPLLNHLSRAALAPQWSPADDSYFPGTNAFDGRSDFPAYWSSSTSDPTLTVDLSLIGDPGFETSSTGWTASSTAVSVASSSGQASGGSYAGLFTCDTTGNGYAYVDISTVPGESLSLNWSLFSSSTGCSATVTLQNRHTGNFLSSGASWSASSSALASWTSTGAWSSGSLNFTVESLTSCLVDTVTLRVFIAASTAGTVYFDDLVLIPYTNWCSVHGHNFTPALTPLLQSHADPGYWITQSTMTLRRDSFYSVLSSGVSARYWRLKLSGTPAAVPYVGEVILGNATEMTDRPQYGGQLEAIESQVRMTSPDGGIWIYSRGAGPMRRFAFDFTYDSSSGYVQARDVFFRGARGGVNPCVVAAADMDSDVVIFGTVAERTTYTSVTSVLRSGGWDVTESPLPNVDYEP